MSTDSVPANVLQKGPALDAALLRNMETGDDVAALLQKAGIDQIVTADKAIGDGFALLENKARLEGVRLLFITWSFHLGDFAEFVSARVVTINEENKVTGKYIVNDGSTGICQQLSEYTEATGSMGGLAVKYGLRRSDYQYEDPTTGESKPATTYYIDTRASE